MKKPVLPSAADQRARAAPFSHTSFSCCPCVCLSLSCFSVSFSRASACDPACMFARQLRCSKRGHACPYARARSVALVCASCLAGVLGVGFWSSALHVKHASLITCDADARAMVERALREHIWAFELIKEPSLLLVGVSPSPSRSPEVEGLEVISLTRFVSISGQFPNCT